ncbi:uncharacterized protein EI90DRAFT_3127932 [Cantharellus anzutake]|uniref:uncharacterized protein n=1 Tax=Cantharellus anzutake TaxID=1750568 RepID=UPI001905DC55|nr:uncharacterized protein EI90DRAFT_3133112 [Cantharellus anzutake]XP_038912844.1 uncharacterized protein EI90DRAFT_3127932 [Cantharellus anzutake]KAF8318624.1 hypothetical protein EI90DRAFT_3133112 [Cantharellus anzutake]KAF8326336.1 hypothetical protein EI90DRAFT_3127932 [Cantharellus anzutake]
MQRLRPSIAVSIIRRYVSDTRHTGNPTSSRPLVLDHIFDNIVKPHPASPAKSRQQPEQTNSPHPAIWQTWGRLNNALYASEQKVSKPEDLWRAYSGRRMAEIQKLQQERAHAGMYWGRSFPVTNGNFIAAYSRVMTTLRDNRVRQEQRLAERFEKPTDKRRRLKSERHRRRFAEMISQKVKIVRAIRERGG